jgi:hypothetical protein
LDIELKDLVALSVGEKGCELLLKSLDSLFRFGDAIASNGYRDR